MKITYENKTQDFYYGNDRGRSVGLYCSPHLHYHMEIAYLKRGRVKAVIDSATFGVDEGDLLVVFPNKIHRFEDETDENEYDLFIINPNLVPDLMPRISNENPQDPVIRRVCDNARIMALLEILRNTDSLPTDYKQVLLKGYLTSFFAEMLEMLPMTGADPNENHAIKTIVEYCAQNFTKDISLTSLEEELHLSKYYISHLFGEKLGIRFNDYLNSLRVSEACRLIRMTDMSITEISGRSGFGTLRTFNRAFMKQMGMSPSEYKKNSRKESLGATVS